MFYAELKVKTKTEQIENFWNFNDFGYIKRRISEIRVYCKGKAYDDSQLECSDHTKMCRARNILIDFKNLNSKNKNNRYRDDIIKPGDVGGHCELQKTAFLKQGDHRSPLQSWFAELGDFQNFDYKPIKDGKCDVVFDEPTILIKLDMGMYKLEKNYFV